MTQLTSEIKDGILTLRFNRPEKKNALTSAMYQAGADALNAAAGDASVRVVLIAGTQGSFSAGNDLQDFMQNPPKLGEDNHPVARFMRAVAGVPKPLIAAVNGHAVGIGTTLLLHCDLAYAGESARFQLPFVNIGICAELASTYLLPRAVGYVRAAELILLGEAFDAHKALAYGLINEVLPDADCEARALNRAQRLAQQPPQALRTNKALLRRWCQDTVMEAIKIEAEHFIPMLNGAEAREAIGAVLQKRKPDFSKFS
ncbi:MAG: enoyl-CoA hydratase [Stenotrophobium sp.]